MNINYKGFEIIRHATAEDISIPYYSIIKDGIVIATANTFLEAQQKIDTSISLKHFVKQRISEKDLYAFIWRADSFEKIVIATNWIKAHVKNGDLLNDLMCALSEQRLMLIHTAMKEY